MQNIIRISSICLCAISLTGCFSYSNSGGYNDYQPYTYEGQQLYPEGYDSYYYPQGTPYQDTVKKGVEVPETYHVGPYHSPTSHKDRDKRWVATQNPQGYTIELGRGEKASEIAKKLFSAPKNDRMAQIKVDQGGRTYYEGLYGSYSDYETARKAFDTLPDNLKQGATIKSWGNVQRNIR